MFIAKSVTYFPNLIKAMMKNNDTISSLAKELGVSPASLSRRLSGDTDFKKTEIDIIITRYKEPYDVLFKAA